MQGNSSLDSVLNPHKINRLKELMGARFPAFLQTFIDSGENLVSKIGAAFAAGDFETVRISAHTLKSTCQIGAAELLSFAQSLEQAAKSGEVEIMGPIINDLTSSYRRAASEARALQAEAAPQMADS